MDSLAARFEGILGEHGVLRGDAVHARATSYWDPAPMRARLLLRPRTTAEISAVMALCHAIGQRVVVLGGLTGTVAGAVADQSAVALSLERMTAIDPPDTVGGTCVVQAGATLRAVQEALAPTGMAFPLDLGARGSCTIGGTVATNAGGINVLRYGMMRSLVLGLEAVLADGTVLSSMNAMQKNNAGYDLKQLFIGSEGTLGIVTRVVLRLFPRTTSRQSALVAFERFDAVSGFLGLLRRDLGGTLSAYEVMWESYFRQQVEAGRHRSPFDRPHAFYAMVEAEGARQDEDAERFRQVLEQALEDGSIVDAVLPKSDQERRSLWDIREDLEAVLQGDPVYLYDVSLPIRDMPGYAQRVESALRQRWPASQCFVMGHIADGNLHLFVQPRQAGTAQAESDEIVYGPLAALGGSVSAEHGIGFDKKPWLYRSRSSAELGLMRGLKRLLDPKGILNPGCVVDA
jgi:FAD/FMN-containing dehydrogenase